MTSPESENTSTSYDTSVEFASNLEPRLRNNPVFLKAQEVQYTFAAMEPLDASTSDGPSELDRFWRGNQKIAELNAEQKAEGLDKHDMVLDGKGIHIPLVTTDLARFSTSVRNGDDEYREKKSFETTMSPYAVKGKFKGFTVRFEPTNEADKYMPILCYRVSMGIANTPQASIEYFATGDVGTTSIDFENDLELDRVEDLIESLQLYAPDTVEEVKSLVASLSREKIDVENISYAAWKAKEILTFVENDKKPIAENALSDLIQHYLNKSPKYKLRTRDYLKSQDENDEETKVYISQKGSGRAFLEPVLDVTFMDEYEKTEKGARSIGQRALYLIISEPDSDEYTYVPIHRLIEFSKK